MLDEMMQVSPVFAVEHVVPFNLHEMMDLADLISGYCAAYFYDPDLHTHFLALGESVSVTLAGVTRFEEAKQFVERMNQIFEAKDLSKVRVFGGFAFETSTDSRLQTWTGWPDGKLFVPAVLLEHHEEMGETSLTVFAQETNFNVPSPADDANSRIWRDWIVQRCRPESKADNEYGTKGIKSQADLPSVHRMSDERLRTSWIRLVEQGSVAVRKGWLKKVVLARYVVEPVHRKISEALSALHLQYPHNFTFALWNELSCFIGSSPERLASVYDNTLNVDCLAGSERRGQTSDEDNILGERLLASSKNLAEHKAVVDWVTDKVAPFVADLDVAAKPRLKKLSNVQHLYTPVRGTVKDTTGIFEIVRTLHPTPAVAGVPESDALRFIRDYEQIDRGWYAGPVGWVDLKGNGTFAVALRSGLVSGDRAALFAGAGIMGDPVPETEWEETELKFMPMREALACNRDSRPNEEK